MANAKTPEFTSRDTVKISDLRDWHEVRVTCTACGRDASLFRSHLRKRFADHMAVADAMARAKCSQCGAKGQTQWAIYRMNRY